MNDTVNLCGLKIKCYSDIGTAAVDIFNNHINNSSSAIAINPEKLLMCYKDPSTAELLGTANVLYLDGIGAVKAAERKFGKRLNRIPGCELWFEVCRLSAIYQRTVFLIGGRPNIISTVAKKLKLEHNVNIIGYADGYNYTEGDLISLAKRYKADIISVALGSPMQEEFILKCREAGVKSFMMGVGGSYDVFSGTVSRAPVWMIKANLEWLYRLLRQPTRFKRYFSLLHFATLVLVRKI